MVTIPNFLDSLDRNFNIPIQSRRFISNILNYVAEQNLEHDDAVNLAHRLINNIEGITKDAIDAISFEPDTLGGLSNWVPDTLYDVEELGDIYSRQVRADFTSYCLNHDIEPDTDKYNDMLDAMFEKLSAHDISLDEFGDFMSQDLIN